jgi:hypothetical protein
MSKNRRRTTIIVTMVGLFLALVGGVAYASIPDSNGVIHACRKNTDGSVRVIDTDLGQTCASGWTAFTWNQTGPQGPTGATGAQGPAGADGVSGLQTFEASGTANATSIKTLAVACPNGKVALGGGVEVDPFVDMAIVASVPQGATGDGSDNASGWLAEVKNNDSNAQTVHVWVICAIVGS